MRAFRIFIRYMCCIWSCRLDVVSNTAARTAAAAIKLVPQNRDTRVCYCNISVTCRAITDTLARDLRCRIVTRRVSAQHLKSDNPDLTPAAAAATDTKRITRSRSTAADLVPPLEKHGRKRQALDDSNSGSSDAAAGSSGKRLTCSICLEDVAVSKMHRMGEFSACG